VLIENDVLGRRCTLTGEQLSFAPRYRDAPLILLLAGALVANAVLTSRPVTPLGLLAVGLITLPLLWRTRVPMTCMVLVTVGVFACLLTLKPVQTVALPTMLAAYSVALQGRRARSVALAAVLVPLSLIAVFAFSHNHPGTGDVLANPAYMLLAVVLGDAVRVRRAYWAAANLRAEERKLEAVHESQRLVNEERLRIARDVHDVVAHAMVAINVQAGAAAHVVDRQPERTKQALLDIKETAGAALADLRRTLGILRIDGAAAPLRPADATSDLSDLALPLRAAGVEVDTRLPDRSELEDVPSSVVTVAYRIVQEAATNILRHTGARYAGIEARVSGDALEVSIWDDGASDGAPGAPAEHGSGSGVEGMAARAESLGGSLQAGRQDGGGWRVYAVLPFS
jgi:signal transduction histidine kinase